MLEIDFFANILFHRIVFYFLKKLIILIFWHLFLELLSIVPALQL